VKPDSGILPGESFVAGLVPNSAILDNRPDDSLFLEAMK